MITYKIDVMEELKKAGYNTTRIRKEGIMAEGALQGIREGKAPGPKILNLLCKLLKKQPGQIIQWEPDK